MARFAASCKHRGPQLDALRPTMHSQSAKHGGKLLEFFRMQAEEHLIEQHRLRTRAASSMKSERFLPNRLVA